jgi:DNA-binding NarL/FixJ family response regulator
MVRERLAEVIHREPDLLVCGEAEDHRQALQALADTRPDLVILDLTLKRSHGLDFLKDVRILYPGLAVLVVSMHDESLYAERVLHAGARGYITKQQATRHVLEAIRTVLDGEIYLSRNLVTRVTGRLAAQPRGRLGLGVEKLTDRELQVFELLGAGYGTRQAADSLGLEMRTVETYRARIKSKLRLKDGNELLQHAIRWQQSGGGR